MYFTLQRLPAVCGADIEGIEPDTEIDRFIDGHARIKRSHAAGDAEASDKRSNVR
jgi:hypothetical protein